jgi:hypothetical protein
MNTTTNSGKSPLQQLLDFRNRAEQLRMVARGMRDRRALLMLSVAAGYDRAAEAVQAALSRPESLRP